MRKALAILLLVVAFALGTLAGFGVPDSRADNPCWTDCINGVEYVCCQIGGCNPTGRPCH